MLGGSLVVALRGIAEYSEHLLMDFFLLVSVLNLFVLQSLVIKWTASNSLLPVCYPRETCWLVLLVDQALDCLQIAVKFVVSLWGSVFNIRVSVVEVLLREHSCFRNLSFVTNYWWSLGVIPRRLVSEGFHTLALKCFVFIVFIGLFLYRVRWNAARSKWTLACISN